MAKRSVTRSSACVPTFTLCWTIALEGGGAVTVTLPKRVLRVYTLREPGWMIALVAYPALLLRSIVIPKITPVGGSARVRCQ